MMFYWYISEHTYTCTYLTPVTPYKLVLEQNKCIHIIEIEIIEEFVLLVIFQFIFLSALGSMVSIPWQVLCLDLVIH